MRADLGDHSCRDKENKRLLDIQVVTTAETEEEIPPANGEIEAMQLAVTDIQIRSSYH